MAKRKNVKHRLTPVSDVLQSLLQNGKSPLASGFTRWKLEQKWADVVGAQLAEDTLPVGFDRGVLYIWVRHPTWIQQLSFFQSDIVQKVNEYLGYKYARSVRFTLDRKASVDSSSSGAD